MVIRHAVIPSCAVSAVSRLAQVKVQFFPHKLCWCASASNALAITIRYRILPAVCRFDLRTLSLDSSFRFVEVPYAAPAQSTYVIAHRIKGSVPRSTDQMYY